MSLELPARPSALAWSNPVAWWWGFLTLVSAANVAIWVALYRHFGEQPAAAPSSEIGLMLLLCAGYVFGCAFRSILPRADVQRICTVDVPMYFNRWRTGRAGGNVHLPLFEGLRDVSTRWVVTHDLAEWKEEIAWMSLYFSGAVWASLALVVFCALADQLPRYRNEVAANAPSHVVIVNHVQPARTELAITQ